MSRIYKLLQFFHHDWVTPFLAINKLSIEYFLMVETAILWVLIVKS